MRCAINASDSNWHKQGWDKLTSPLPGKSGFATVLEVDSSRRSVEAILEIVYSVSWRDPSTESISIH
jgi:hypothetical protein